MRFNRKIVRRFSRKPGKGFNRKACYGIQEEACLEVQQETLIKCLTRCPVRVFSSKPVRRFHKNPVVGFKRKSKYVAYSPKFCGRPTCSRGSGPHHSPASRYVSFGSPHGRRCIGETKPDRERQMIEEGDERERRVQGKEEGRIEAKPLKTDR